MPCTIFKLDLDSRLNYYLFKKAVKLLPGQDFNQKKRFDRLIFYSLHIFQYRDVSKHLRLKLHSAVANTFNVKKSGHVNKHNGYLYLMDIYRTRVADLSQRAYNINRKDFSFKFMPQRLDEFFLTQW
jgi:hypothetical protein